MARGLMAVGRGFGRRPDVIFEIGWLVGRVMKGGLPGTELCQIE